MDGRAGHGVPPWRVMAGAPLRGWAWRELAYALTMPLMILVGPVYLFVVVLSVLITTSVIGVPLLALVVLGARGLGRVNRALAGALAGAAIPPPPALRSGPGVLDRLAAALGDVTGWRAVLHGVARLPAAALAFAAAAGLWGLGLVLLTCPLWWQNPPFAAGPPWWRDSALAAALATVTPGTWSGALLMSAAGAALLVAAPWGLHLALAPERWAARALLGPTRGALRIRALEQTRTRAVDEAAAELRRIERDLHDGTAARLVTLAMRLGMAQEDLAHAAQTLPDDTRDGYERLERARALVDGAHRDAKDTLTELRELIHGIHPAALDKGLEVALATLAARHPLSVTLEADLPRRPSPAVESIAFFCTAELLANVVKHSGARHAGVEVRERQGLLRLLVRDDGTGGAVMGAGTGLSGLADRIGVVDGRLAVHSPRGGPTVVTVELPMYI
ncbi:sensor domain-containing protein [Streptosporangium sp. NPDC023615]|uniref:sensor histidine kinase n=1 Tax=Streptosporangium sp. NPDC023615 TaxID=3154794 RepID=UPI0034372B12